MFAGKAGVTVLLKVYAAHLRKSKLVLVKLEIPVSSPDLENGSLLWRHPEMCMF